MIGPGMPGVANLHVGLQQGLLLNNVVSARGPTALSLSGFVQPTGSTVHVTRIHRHLIFHRLGPGDAEEFQGSRSISRSLYVFVAETDLSALRTQLTAPARPHGRFETPTCAPSSDYMRRHRESRMVACGSSISGYHFILFTLFLFCPSPARYVGAWKPGIQCLVSMHSNISIYRGPSKDPCQSCDFLQACTFPEECSVHCE